MATAKKVKKKAAARTSGRKAAARKAGVRDLRAPLAPTDANLEKVLAELREVLARIPEPDEPSPGDLIHALMHFVLNPDRPSGHGQEAVRRIEDTFVDRNEFRVTEAYEVAEMLDDLGLPQCFERCLELQEAIGQIYNDQNVVSLDFLREAGVAERNAFFARVPAVRPRIARSLVNLISFEECIFSERSTLRVQQRLGLEPKSAGVERFLAGCADRLEPFGHLPLIVGKDRADGRPLAKPALSPAELVLRLAPPPKR